MHPSPTPPGAPLTFRLDDGRTAHVLFTDRHAGDLRVDGDATALAARRAALVAHPWTWMHQVHGADLVVVDAPGAHAGATADAAVVVASDAPVAVHTADCAPVALVARGVALAVVHAGWRGLAAGVLERAVTALRAVGGDDVVAVLGPCIHAECYEFGADDLAVLADRYGASVRGRTTGGRDALDVPAAVAASLGALDVPLDAGPSVCTACDERWFSHRARTETGRQALVGWIRG